MFICIDDVTKLRHSLIFQKKNEKGNEYLAKHIEKQNQSLGKKKEIHIF